MQSICMGDVYTSNFQPSRDHKIIMSLTKTITTLTIMTTTVIITRRYLHSRYANQRQNPNCNPSHNPNLLNLKSKGFLDTVSRITIMPSFKSFRSRVCLLSCITYPKNNTNKHHDKIITSAPPYHIAYIVVSDN